MTNMKTTGKYPAQVFQTLHNQLACLLIQISFIWVTETKHFDIMKINSTT